MLSKAMPLYVLFLLAFRIYNSSADRPSFPPIFFLYLQRLAPRSPANGFTCDILV